MRTLSSVTLLLALLTRAPAIQLATGHSAPPALFVTDSLKDWLRPESREHKGLLVSRTMDCAWDEREMDGLGGLSIGGARLRTSVENCHCCSDDLPARLHDSISKLLTEAGSLPESLREQIRSDACSIGSTVGAMCPTARELELVLEVFGENTCARWHIDQFMGRAIVTYTGVEGTMYSGDSNVNLWQLQNGGKNDRIIHDVAEVESVNLGDILFIKGSQFPHGEAGLVHKSPTKRYHEDGRVVNRLLLKIDVVS